MTGSGESDRFCYFDRTRATFRLLYAKISKNFTHFYCTYDYDAYKTVIPPNKHILGKESTTYVESNNALIRQNLGKNEAKNQMLCEIS
jgi:IS1 family transposase